MNPFDPDAPLTEEDLSLLAEIGAAQQALDPPPPHLTERMLLAVSLTLMEAELAVLVEGPLEAVRAEPSVVESVTFTASSVSLMITPTRVDSGVVIDGWVTGGGILVELHAGGEVIERTSDATGRLAWPPVPAGRVRFLIRPARDGGRPVITPTIEV